MTIHSTHPFATEPDPLRRLRGRLGGAVSLWTAGRAGLTVTSLLVAVGEPGRVLALLDPDADLTAALTESGRGVVHLLRWEHRDLASMFAGQAPAPGGVFAQAAFEDTAWGPRLETATTWAGVRLESVAPVGLASLVTCVVESVVIGPDDAPLAHRRGRWFRPAGD